MKTAIVAMLLLTAIASPANAGNATRPAWSSEYFQSESARTFVTDAPVPTYYPSENRTEAVYETKGTSTLRDASGNVTNKFDTTIITTLPRYYRR